MKVLLSSCLLLALLTPVAALSCKSCFGRERTCKEEDTKTVKCAPDQDVCMTVSADQALYYFPFVITYKGCSRSQECQSAYYAATFGSTYGQARSYCCQTDECNAQDMPVPDRSSLRPNGLRCPAFSSSSDSCYGQEIIQCVGTEDQCVEVIFDMSPFGLPAKQIHARGCGNQNLCSTKPGPLLFGNGLLKYNIYNVRCYGSPGSCKLHQSKW